MKTTIFAIFMQFAVMYWWICLAYTRYKTAQAKALENAKYAHWDKVYKKALWESKGPYQATVEAVKATHSSPHVLRIWQDTYDKAVDAGVRKYTAGVKASAAAREAAHK